LNNNVETNQFHDTWRKTFGKINSASGIGVIIAYIVLFVFLSLTTEYFCTVENILIVIRQAVWYAIMGIGMTFVIAMCSIDLSIGSTLGATGIVVAVLIKAGVNIHLSIFIALIPGLVIGIINSLLVTKVHLPEFIATLGVSSVIRGLIMVYTRGVPIYGLRYPDFQYVAQGFVGFIPIPIIILFVLLVIFYFLMYRTRLGRYTLSIGSNAEAARLVGINIDRIKMIIFALNGLLAAIAGIIITARSEAGVAEAGSGYEMEVIAATVIGGTSMSGGKASLVGTVLGAILMATVRNGLNLLGISSLWHQVIIGLFIIIAVSIDSISTKNKKSR
jgi:ribose transport system permease protein